VFFMRVFYTSAPILMLAIAQDRDYDRERDRRPLDSPA
jgi:hypothetical protein